MTSVTVAEYHLAVSQHASRTSINSSWRKWLLLLVFPLLPLYFVLLALFLVGRYVVTEARRRMRAWQLRGTMQKASRTASWADIEADLASGIGTIIVDAPCLGWHSADVWWTRESVKQRAAIEGLTPSNKSSTDSIQGECDAHMEEFAFDRWCQVRYFDAAGGIAKLMQTSHSRRDRDKARSRIQRLKSAFPTLEHVETDTGLARMAGKANQSDES